MYQFFPRYSKCWFTVHKYTSVLFGKKTMLKSNIFVYKIFMILKDISGEFVRPMEITTHLYTFYLIRNEVFRISSSVI